jgi:peptidoglycan/xylan/chitin deacetylase (PgdA/CDA1 family)
VRDGRRARVRAPLAMRPSLRAAVLGRGARRSARRAGVVLAYHRVGSAGGATGLLGAEVHPAVLARQLAHLAGRYRVVRLSELRAAVEERTPGQPFPVALTFDDDLSTHVREAMPALAAAGLPATLFLTGASLAAPRPFWWDDLGRALDRGARLPPSLPETSDVRQLARAIEALPAHELGDLAQQLGELAGPEREPGLRAADVAELARRGFEIGFHTLRHRRLDTLDDDDLDAALREGRGALEEAAGCDIRRVAYPHGRADARVAAAAGAAGYDEGFTGAGRPVLPDTEPMLIARYEAARTVEGLSLQVARAVGH